MQSTFAKEIFYKIIYKVCNAKAMFENKFQKLFFIEFYSLNLKGLFSNHFLLCKGRPSD
jgi:hypothetical protein